MPINNNAISVLLIFFSLFSSLVVVHWFYCLLVLIKQQLTSNINKVWEHVLITLNLTCIEKQEE